MGEYADMAARDGVDDWRGAEGGPVWAWGHVLPPHKPCRRCGYPALYWQRTAQGWRLHHWTMFGDMKRPAYVLHRCGFQSDGTPKPQGRAALSTSNNGAGG